MAPYQLHHLRRVAERAQPGHQPSVVVVAARNRIERAGDEQRDLHAPGSTGGTSATGPSKAAQAFGLSRSVTFNSSTAPPPAPSRPSRSAARSRPWRWAARNSVVVLLPL